MSCDEPLAAQSRAAKNGAVVASVAMPVGTITPARPRLDGEACEQFGEQRIGVDVAAPGERKAPALFAVNAGEDGRRFGRALGRFELLVQRSLAGAGLGVLELGDQLARAPPRSALPRSPGRARRRTPAPAA